MKGLFLALSLLGVTSATLRSSLLRSLKLRIVLALLYGGIVVLAHPWLLTVSMKACDAYLASQPVQDDLFLLLSLDFLLLLAALEMALVRHPQWRLRRPHGDYVALAGQVVSQLAYRAPSPWGLAALVYLRLYLLYALPGWSFEGVTLGLALLVALVTIFAPQLLRWVKARPLIAPLPTALAFATMLIAKLTEDNAFLATPYGPTADYTALWQALLFLAILAGLVFLTYWWQLHRARRKRQ